MKYQRDLPKRPPDPGELRHTGVLQSASVSAAADGEPVESWATYATVRFARAAQGGREMWEARQRNSEVQFRLTLWRRADVLPAHRLLSGSNVYEVLWVDNDDSHILHTYLYCREVNASVS